MFWPPQPPNPPTLLASANDQYGAEDDTTSFYSSAPSQIPSELPTRIPTNGNGVHNGGNLNSALEDLSLDNNHIHATVRNGYEEDFEGYGDDGAGGMGQEVDVEHACRYV
jgi:hypothetical protein